MMIEDEAANGDSGNDDESPSEELERQVVSLLQNGRKIEAVKLVREQFGSGLKDAKEAVEAIGRKNGIESSAGCAGMLLLATGVSIALASQFV